jgi:hypothetical protein
MDCDDRFLSEFRYYAYLDLAFSHKIDGVGRIALRKHSLVLPKVQNAPAAIGFGEECVNLKHFFLLFILCFHANSFSFEGALTAQRFYFPVGSVENLKFPSSPVKLFCFERPGLRPTHLWPRTCPDLFSCILRFLCYGLCVRERGTAHPLGSIEWSSTPATRARTAGTPC